MVRNRLNGCFKEMLLKIIRYQFFKITEKSPIIKLLYFIQKCLISRQQKEVPHAQTERVVISRLSCLVHMFSEWKQETALCV